jgi:dinuclear metal center YbgI/SA1388 family protein
MVSKAEIVRFLDDYLSVREIEDSYTRNGLVVDGREEVRRIAFAVDACLAVFEQAKARGADMVLTHHGLFWPTTAAITGDTYARVRSLAASGISLYSCHLPLDGHGTVGNNVLLVKALGADVGEAFDGYCRYGSYPEPLGREEFLARIRSTVSGEAVLLPFGRERILRFAVCSGGGASHANTVKDDPLVDAFVTGEAAHYCHHLARENGMNIVFAGHYATEVFGVRALCEMLAVRFGVACDFIDMPTGL